MRKLTHLKKVVSLAVAAAMAVSVCTTALAEETVTDTTNDEIVLLDAEQGGNDQQEEKVARVGEEEFTSFVEALNKAEELDNQTVTLLSDVTIDDAAFNARKSGSFNFKLLSSGKTMTLDLNGRTITTGLRDQNGNHRSVDNLGGNLTIKDSQGNGTIIARNTENLQNGTMTLESGTIVGCDYGAGSGVWNEGTFTMNGGTLKVTGQKNTANRTAPTPLVNNSASATAQLNAGKLEGTYTNIGVNNGTVTVEKDVQFSGTTDSDYPTIKNQSEIILNAVTINSQNGSCIENAVGTATLNNCTFTQNGENGSQQYAANAVAASQGGTTTINGGSYMGFKYGAYVYNSGATINIVDGTFEAKDAVLKADDSTTENPSCINVAGGKFSGTFAIGPADTTKLTISGGYFTNEVVSTYIADGKYCNKLETKYEDTYAYQVGEKQEVEVKPEVVVKEPEVKAPAEDAKIEETKKADATKVASKTQFDTTTAAGEKPEDNQTSSTLDKARDEAIQETVTEETKAEAEEKYADEVGALESEMAYVVMPYLEIEPKAYSEEPAADGTILTLDITPKYNLVLTTKDIADAAKTDSSVIKTEGEAQNAVTVADNRDMSIKAGQDVKLSIEVNDTVKTALQDKDIFILHDHEGKKFIYEAKMENNTITFVNPNGFSDFSVLAIDPTTAVKIDFETIGEKTYNMNAVSAMQEFPAATKDGYTFKGWKIGDKTVTNMSYDLWAVLSQTEVNKATAVFEKNAEDTKPSPEPTAPTPAEPSPAPTTAPTAAPAAESTATATPAPTAAPAASGAGYYTCKACGYHDWTATSEGYKCNHCGYVESVKQLSGYKNVKGVYEPKTSTAKEAKTTATIPQTSDEMPIVPIAIIAVAALLGLGVTVVLKKKNKQ